MIVYKGRPVPWITRWSSEICDPGPALIPSQGPHGVLLNFEGEVPEDRIDGLLYLRSYNSPGIGEPRWKDIHTERQRRCMREGLCQVCGRKIPEPIPWIIPVLSLTSRVGKTRLNTEVAPVCEPCLPVALKYCPHLSGWQPKIIEVRGYRVSGVFGDIVDTDREGRIRHFQGDRRIDAYLGNIMVRQTMVEIWDFRKRRP